MKMSEIKIHSETVIYEICGYVVIVVAIVAIVVVVFSRLATVLVTLEIRGRWTTP